MSVCVQVCESMCVSVCIGKVVFRIFRREVFFSLNRFRGESERGQDPERTEPPATIPSAP